jgi:quercetin dioxygenase-like cupin family protein
MIDTPSSTRRPIERDRYFIRRADQGLKMTQESEAGELSHASPGVQALYANILTNPEISINRLLNQADTLDGYGVDYIRLRSGRDFPDHCHERRCGFIFVVVGQGQVRLDGELYPIAAGDCVFLKPGVFHEFLADPGPLEWLAITRPDLREVDPDGTFDFVLRTERP